MAGKNAKPLEGLFPVTSTDVQRPRWKSNQEVRMLRAELVGAGRVEVWVEHRKHSGLAFRLELDAEGRLLGFYVRPFAFRFRRYQGGLFAVADLATPPQADGRRRLSATLMRDVPLGQLETAATASLGLLGQLARAEVPTEPKRTRSDRVSDLEVARFASAFVDAMGRGDRAPLATTARQFNLSYNGGSARRRAAVERGILTDTTQGKAGGTLTAKALKLLER